MLGKGDADAVEALARYTASKNLPLAYACADALRSLAAADGIDPKLAGRAANPLLQPAAYANSGGAYAIPLAATALGEPGRDWLLALVGAEVATKGFDWQLMRIIVSRLRIAGVPEDHDTIQEAAKQSKVIQRVLTDHRKADGKEAGGKLPDSYTEFWQGVDADRNASGAPQPAW